MKVHRSPEPLEAAIEYARTVAPSTLSRRGHVIVVTNLDTNVRVAFVLAHKEHE